MRKRMMSRVPGAFLFAALTVVGARLQITVPGLDTPMTLQSVAVLTAPIALGSVGGIVAMLIYIAAGAAGLPVFAGGRGGLDVLLGASGGYLAGFILAQIVVARLIDFDRRMIADWRMLTKAATAGHAVILSSGWLWMVGGVGIGGGDAFARGVWPFLPAALIKSALVVLLGPFALNRRIKRRLDPSP